MLFLLYMFISCSAQNDTLRALNTIHPSSCPDIGEGRSSLRTEVERLLENFVLANNSSPVLYPDRPCGCGGPGWTKVVSLNMSDTTQQCPGDWEEIASPVRGCQQTTPSGCTSAVFQTGRTYSQVCGRVNAYQYGSPDAFSVAITARNIFTVEQNPLSGVSLTHGAPGSRQHIWSFVAAILEYSPNPAYRQYKCACSDTTTDWPYTTPSFVGNNYFCDSGNLGPVLTHTIYYPDNPMWDGEGCGPTSSCCQFNNPPWFCKTLPQPSSDPVELRICDRNSQERSIVYLAEIFVG